MADRKQFRDVQPASARLTELLDQTRDVVVSEEQLREQRISFAFGNAPHSSKITRESVERAAQSMRLIR